MLGLRPDVDRHTTSRLTSVNHPKTFRFAERMKDRFHTSGISGSMKKYKKLKLTDEGDIVIDDSHSKPLRVTHLSEHKQEEIAQDALRLQMLEDKLAQIREMKRRQKQRAEQRAQRKKEHKAALLVQVAARKFLNYRVNHSADVIVAFIKASAAKQAVAAATWAIGVLKEFFNKCAVRWRRYHERQELTHYFAETTYQSALNHYFTSVYSQSLVGRLLDQGVRGVLETYQRELAERLAKKQKKQVKKRFHPLTKPSIPSPMKPPVPTQSPARSQSGLPPMHTLQSHAPPRSVSGLPVLMRQGSMDDSEIPSPPPALAPPGRLVKSNTSGNLLKLQQKKLTTTPQVSKPNTPSPTPKPAVEDPEAKRMELLRRMHSEKVEQMEHERLQRLKAIEQRRAEREAREAARAKAVEERAALKEKQKLDFLRKVTTEQVERARIVVRMKSLSDKRKEEQEKLAAEEREREHQERKGLFAHDARFEENMERVRQKIRSSSYDAKEAASLSRRNSFAELHRLPSIGASAPKEDGIGDTDGKPAQRSRSAGKNRKVSGNNIPKQASAKLNNQTSTKLRTSNKNMSASPSSKSISNSPSNKNIAEHGEAHECDSVSDASSPTRMYSSRRPFEKNTSPPPAAALPSKSGIASTSTKSSKVKAAAVVVSLLAAAGALDAEENTGPSPEEIAAQEQAAREREAALQKRIAMKRQVELEEKQRKIEEIKQRKEQQERIAAKAQALLKKSAATKKERQKANRQRGKNMIKQKHESIAKATSSPLSLSMQYGQKHAVAAEHWGWSKDDFDPLAEDYEVKVPRGKCELDRGDSPQRRQQQEQVAECSAPPPVPIDISHVQPKPSKHSPISSLASFTRLGSVPTIPTLPIAPMLSSTRHGSLMHIENEQKSKISKKKPQKNKSASTFANLSLTAKHPSKRRISPEAASPPKVGNISSLLSMVQRAREKLQITPQDNFSNMETDRTHIPDNIQAHHCASPQCPVRPDSKAGCSTGSPMEASVNSALRSSSDSPFVSPGKGRRLFDDNDDDDGNDVGYENAVDEETALDAECERLRAHLEKQLSRAKNDDYDTQSEEAELKHPYEQDMIEGDSDDDVDGAYDYEYDQALDDECEQLRMKLAAKILSARGFV